MLLSLFLYTSTVPSLLLLRLALLLFIMVFLSPLSIRSLHLSGLALIPSRARSQCRRSSSNLLTLLCYTTIRSRIMVRLLPSLLGNGFRLRSVLLQVLVAHYLERFLMRSMQIYLRDRALLELALLCRSHCIRKVLGRKACAVAFFQRFDFGCRVLGVLEVVGHGGGDGVVVGVVIVRTTVSVFEEAYGWVLGEEAKHSASN